MYGYPYYGNYQGNFATQQNYQPQQTQTQDDRIWVSNQQAGEAYLLAPSSFVRLWDSSTNRFYEKRSDATGRPLPIDIYEYKRISLNTATLTDEVSKLSSEDIIAKFDAVNARIEALENAKKGANKNAKQSNADDTNV